MCYLYGIVGVMDITSGIVQTVFSSALLASLYNSVNSR